MGSEITAVTRQSDQVTHDVSDGKQQFFDEVVFACHSNQTLQLLGELDDEKVILGGIPYQPNEVVLHTDTTGTEEKACLG